MPLRPRDAAGDAAAADTSAYATTSEVPPVPAGGAVEFAVDYAAGTCRVAFYTPAAVAGGFIKAPHAKMELRFVATDAEDAPEFGAIPARSVPSAAADSRVQLYPFVGLCEPVLGVPLLEVSRATNVIKPSKKTSQTITKSP
jgi:hypothetical protein